MSEWLNTKRVIWKKIIKPCRLSGYCPYGQLVEEFPFSKTKRSCKVFGHDCPAFYHGELFMEEHKITNKEVAEMKREFKKRLEEG